MGPAAAANSNDLEFVRHKRLAERVAAMKAELDAVTAERDALAASVEALREQNAQVWC